MPLVGRPPIGIIPIGTFAGEKLSIEDVAITWDPLGDDIYVPGVLWTHGVDVLYDPIGSNVVQTHLLKIDDVDLSFDIDDVSVIQTQLLHSTDVELRFSIDDIWVIQTHLITIDSIEYRYEVPDLRIIQTHLLHSAEYIVRWQPTDVRVGQTHRLSINDVPYIIALPDIWMFLPQECVDYSSRLEIESGLMIDDDPDGTVSSARWFHEDQYRLFLNWQHTSKKVALGLTGFFRSFRYQPVLVLWKDGYYYHMVLADDADINQVSWGPVTYL